MAEQTALKLGHVEQLYTFGDRGRHTVPGDTGPHLVSVGYLALTRIGDEVAGGAGARPRPLAALVRLLPVGGLARGTAGGARRGDPAGAAPLEPHGAAAGTGRAAAARPARALRLAFGDDGARWDEERVLDRYELLYEAGLVLEAERDGRPVFDRRGDAASPARSMRFDHRRILATAISRLRAKLKYRPVVFELMADAFTLTELQRTVEAISGRHLHKQNFRRLVEGAALVEPTGGRPPRRSAAGRRRSSASAARSCRNARRPASASACAPEGEFARLPAFPSGCRPEPVDLHQGPTNSPVVCGEPQAQLPPQTAGFLMTKWVYSFGGGKADGSAEMREPSRRQGRQPRRDVQPRPAGASRLHHHHRGLHLLLCATTATTRKI